MPVQQHKKLRFNRALAGALLSAGAPLGWIVILWSTKQTAALVALFEQPGLLSYMLFATMFIFSLFGYYAGFQEEKVEKLAIRDHLTGLYNVRFLREELYLQLALSDRLQQPSVW